MQRFHISRWHWCWLMPVDVCGAGCRFNCWRRGRSVCVKWRQCSWTRWSRQRPISPRAGCVLLFACCRHGLRCQMIVTLLDDCRVTTNYLRDSLHWLPVDKRIEFKLCLLVFKCQHQMAPPYLASMCVQLSADTRSRQLRSAARNDLLIPRTRTASYGLHSFAVSGPTCWKWNSLPLQLKSASLTPQQFCDRLKTVPSFLVATRERCRHDFVIRSRWHKLIL